MTMQLKTGKCLKPKGRHSGIECSVTAAVDLEGRKARRYPKRLGLARNLDDLRKLVLGLTQRGVQVCFVKESLTFTGEDSPMSNLLLSVMGAFAQFERELIRERQREGIAIAKRAGKYRGRKPVLTAARGAELRERAATGESKAGLAREFGISRDTLYRYLAVAHQGSTRSSVRRGGKPL